MKLSEFLLVENYKNIFKHSDMEKYADDVYSIILKSYEKIGGIHITKEQMIEDSDMWKLFVKDGKVLVAFIYKDKNGRKLTAIATDGSQESKKILISDLEKELSRSYVEASGSIEKLLNNVIGPNQKFKIPSKDLTKLTGKKAIEIDPDEHHYSRVIGDKVHRKAMYGTPGLKITPKN